MDLAVGHSGDEIAAHPAMKRLASFTHSGRVAAVEVRQLQLEAWPAESASTGCAADPKQPTELLARYPSASSIVLLLEKLVQVADLGGGALLLLAASCDGSVARLRMTVPTQPGSQPEEIQVGAQAGCDTAWALQWVGAQAGCATAWALHRWIAWLRSISEGLEATKLSVQTHHRW